MSDLEARCHRNLCDFNRWLPRLEPNGRALDRDGVVAVVAPVDSPAARTAVRAGDNVSAAAWVDTAEAFLFADGTTACVFARVGADDDITEILTPHGFAEYARIPEMVCEAALDPRPDPEGFRIRLAVSAADVAAYAVVAGEAFAHLGMPAESVSGAVDNPEHMLVDEVAIAVAESADGPIVAGALSIVLGDEPNGYVGWVACADRARGHGLGDAVTRLVTNEAFDRGARIVTLEASHFGRNTYDRMGYRTLYDYRLLIMV